MNQLIKNYIIAKTISKVRKEHGYSITDTAKHLDISDNELLLIESGEIEIDCTVLVRLSHFFNVRVDDFFTELKDLFN